MSDFAWIVAAFFLPLFPMTMVFNAVYQYLRMAWARVALLLAWPLPGIWLLQADVSAVPDWVAYWALFSAVLYGFRAVVVKEFGVWTGFLATSSWSLVWIALQFGVRPDDLLFHALAFSLPLAVLAVLVGELEKRYESAYAGIVNGLAQAQPRLSGMFVFAMLAVIGSPLFPAFFSMLDVIAHSAAALPAIAVGVVTVWLLWSWSGIRILQELLVGTAPARPHHDIGFGVLVVYSSSLMALVVGGLYISGELL